MAKFRMVTYKYIQIIKLPQDLQKNVKGLVRGSASSESNKVPNQKYIDKNKTTGAWDYRTTQINNSNSTTANKV